MSTKKPKKHKPCIESCVYELKIHLLYPIDFPIEILHWEFKDDTYYAIIIDKRDNRMKFIYATIESDGIVYNFNTIPECNDSAQSIFYGFFRLNPQYRIIVKNNDTGVEIEVLYILTTRMKRLFGKPPKLKYNSWSKTC